MADYWLASGHIFCDPTPEGRLLATPALWRAFLARPELVPPEEACAAERRLHASLLSEPLRPVAAAEIAALEDADARENFGVFLRFRDQVAAAPSLEAAWLALYAGDVRGVPPIFLQMLTHLVAYAAMLGEDDAFAWRAAECLFRTQRAAIHQGALLLADEEVVDARAADGDLGALGRLLTEAGAPPPTVELEVLSETNAETYPGRSDAHDLALDIAENRPGQRGLARALERFISHVLGEQVTITAVPVIADAPWILGLDTEATRIGNALWRGEEVAQAELARILWLGELRFAEESRVLPRVKGRAVVLALAMDQAQRVRLKPQNLVGGLPLLAKGEGA
jgi:hypothetical protein